MRDNTYFSLLWFLSTRYFHKMDCINFCANFFFLLTTLTSTLLLLDYIMLNKSNTNKNPLLAVCLYQHNSIWSKVMLHDIRKLLRVKLKTIGVDSWCSKSWNSRMSIYPTPYSFSLLRTKLFLSENDEVYLQHCYFFSYSDSSKLCSLYLCELNALLLS